MCKLKSTNSGEEWLITESNASRNTRRQRTPVTTSLGAHFLPLAITHAEFVLTMVVGLRGRARDEADPEDGGGKRARRSGFDQDAQDVAQYEAAAPPAAAPEQTADHAAMAAAMMQAAMEEAKARMAMMQQAAPVAALPTQSDSEQTLNPHQRRFAPAIFPPACHGYVGSAAILFSLPRRVFLTCPFLLTVGGSGNELVVMVRGELCGAPRCVLRVLPSAAHFTMPTPSLNLFPWSRALFPTCRKDHRKGGRDHQSAPGPLRCALATRSPLR